MTIDEKAKADDIFSSFGVVHPCCIVVDAARYVNSFCVFPNFTETVSVSHSRGEGKGKGRDKRRMGPATGWTGGEPFRPL